MKKYILLVLITSALHGCKSIEQQCLDKFPPKIVTHDSLIYKERIDTVKWIVPGDTVKVSTQVPCDDFNSDFSTGKEKIRVVVKNKIMYVDRIKQADTVKVFVKTKETTSISQNDKISNIQSNKWLWWLALSITVNILQAILIIRRFL